MISMILRRLVLLVLLASITGCTAFRDPAIVVRNVRPGAVSDEAMTLDFLLELSNPNDASVRLNDFTYRVSVDGVRVYTGVRSAEATLAGLDERTLTIPAVLRFDELGWQPEAMPAFIQYSVTGSLEYTKPGQLTQILLDIGIFRPKARFTGTGEVAVSLLQSAVSDQQSALP